MSAGSSRALADHAHIAWETGLFAHRGDTGVPRYAVARPGSAVTEPPMAGPTTVDGLVAEARERYERVSARAAYQWVLHGRGRLVDIRPEAQRRAEGEVHPSLGPVVVERNVLEWRLDPRGDARLPWVTSTTRVIVLCQEGYASSLAAASLVRLGLTHATDVVGGLRAWREAVLPLA